MFRLVALFIPYRTIAWLSKGKRRNTYAAVRRQFKARDWTKMRLEALGLFAFWVPVVSVLWQPATRRPTAPSPSAGRRCSGCITCARRSTWSRAPTTCGCRRRSAGCG
ncbi:MAG: hypothetical protein U1F43_15920 [Myxococcota bacterium]